jgi:hypothetical protein
MWEVVSLDTGQVFGKIKKNKFASFQRKADKQENDRCGSMGDGPLGTDHAKDFQKDGESPA